MDKKILKDVTYYLSDEQGFVASVIEKDFHFKTENRQTV